EFAISGYFLPVEDGDARALPAAPLPVGVDQGVQHQVPCKERPHFVVPTELAHHRQAVIDFGQYVSISDGSWSLGVVFGEPQRCLFIEEGVHARRWTRRTEARVNLY